MQQQKITAFLKLLIIAFISLVACLLVFRNHYIFGTALIIGRWGFILFGLLLLFFTTKYLIAKSFRYMLLASIALMCVEFIFTKLNAASPEKAAGNTEVTFMTYNLFFKNKHPESVLKQIKEADPDVLVVQELTPAWVSVLSKSIGKQYVYKTIYADKGTHGIAIYSKYKLSNDTLLLNENKKPFAQLVTIRVFNKKIQLINTHTASPAAAVDHPEHFFSLFCTNYLLRENQFEKIEQFLFENNPNEICVLIGDLNTTPYEPIYRSLRNNWIDVFTEAGEGNGSTFPNTSKTTPFLRLDYILIKGAATPVSAKVLASGSSDHLALVGQIRI